MARPGKEVLRRAGRGWAVSVHSAGIVEALRTVYGADWLAGELQAAGVGGAAMAMDRRITFGGTPAFYCFGLDRAYPSDEHEWVERSCILIMSPDLQRCYKRRNDRS